MYVLTSRWRKVDGTPHVQSMYFQLRVRNDWMFCWNYSIYTIHRRTRCWTMVFWLRVTVRTGFCFQFIVLRGRGKQKRIVSNVYCFVRWGPDVVICNVRRPKRIIQVISGYINMGCTLYIIYFNIYVSLRWRKNTRDRRHNDGGDLPSRGPSPFVCAAKLFVIVFRVRAAGGNQWTSKSSLLIPGTRTDGRQTGKTCVFWG